MAESARKSAAARKQLEAMSGRLIAILLAFILGPLFAYFVTRSITHPLRYAVSATETVARRAQTHSYAAHRPST